ncbi:MAG: EAL domain-containing protein [Rhodocyclaceae bacterium]
MKLQTKIWLGSSAMIAMIMAIDMAYTFRHIEAELHEQLGNEARVIQAVLMSTRRIYQKQFLASGLPVNEKTVGFLPAHSLSRISADFPNWIKTGLRFNNVSDRPRNPGNQADPDELTAMAWFRANPQAADRVALISDPQGKNYYHFTAPIWIEKYCLGCHGPRDSAPKSIGAAYAEAYDYKLGDLRGLLSIKLPIDELRAVARSHWLRQLGANAVGYVALLLLLGSLMQRLVVRRLSRLEEAARRLQTGDLAARVAVDGDDEVSRLGEGFNQMADAIASHERQMLRLNSIYTALSNTNKTIVRVDDEAELLETVCRIAVEHGGLKLAWIGGADPRTDRLAVLASFGEAGDYLDGLKVSTDPASPYGNGPTGVAWRTNEPVVDDYASDERTRPRSGQLPSFHWGSSAAFPVTRGGAVHLVLNLYHAERLAFDAKMMDLLSEMAMDIGYALDRIDLVAQQESALRALRESEAKYHTALATSQDGFWQADREGRLIEVNDAYVTLSGYSRAELLAMTIADLDASESDTDIANRIQTLAAKGGGIFETVHRTKSGSLKAVEISATFTESQGGLFSVFVRDLTLRHEAESRIQHLSYFDALTGLPNRALFTDRARQALQQALRQGDSLALIFLDLDHFKQVNDTLGHRIGDLLLIRLTERFQSVLRAEDTICRLGGDEFLFLIPHADAADAGHLAEKLLLSVGEPLTIENHTLSITVSLGIALCPVDGDDVDTLLRRADTATNWAKEEGRNAYRFFTQEMQTVVSARAALEADLRDAVHHDQFLLHYQAQVSGTHDITGAEALVRWRHPLRGLVSPAEFIPIAEETGLILPLGQWVMETACSQLARWATQPDMAHLTLAVNVSARQFRQPAFVDQVLALLERTGARPQRLKLELTESLLVANVEDIVAKMRALKEKGVGFSLDDFGTGYSSLSYLKRLPLDQLKIDQSFVRDILDDPDDAAIARTVVALAESLGLSVIAEGVETEAQRSFLAGQGCHAYQGYLFSRPLPIDDFEALARRPASQC